VVRLGEAGPAKAGVSRVALDARWTATPMAAGERLIGPPEQGFLGSVNRSLGLAVLAAGAAVLALTLVLSRRILRPVEALTAAAERLAEGDLSQRVPVETRDEIGALGRAFNAMADSLARADGLRRNLVTDVAHELRTPLTNLRGYLEALRDGVAEPSPALIDSLYEESLLLSRLVEDLQELALAEAGQLRLARAPLALGPVLSQAAASAGAQASEKGLALEVAVTPDLPAVLADRERVGQVLRNLLQNAIRHTPAGGRIGLEAGAAGAAVEVRVRDSGAGIAAEDLPYVFERFYRADRSRSRTTGGTGLGLAIVKQLVAAHGGEVTVESAPGAGSTFTFTLPVAKFGARVAG
jgi:signal transduction histidine kinase